MNTISPVELSLLKSALEDVIFNLEKNEGLDTVSTFAFDTILESGKIIQVQVTATRDESEFIEPFELVKTISN